MLANAAIQRSYRRGLTGVKQVRLLPFDVDRGETPQWVDALAEDRDRLVEYLLQSDMHCRTFWFPIHTQQPYRAPDDRFPNAIRLTEQAVWLPSALSLTDDDVQAVCRRIADFYAGRSV